MKAKKKKARKIAESRTKRELRLAVEEALFRMIDLMQRSDDPELRQACRGALLKHVARRGLHAEKVAAVLKRIAA